VVHSRTNNAVKVTIRREGADGNWAELAMDIRWVIMAPRFNILPQMKCFSEVPTRDTELRLEAVQIEASGTAEDTAVY
jgi:hypothetical protein